MAKVKNTEGVVSETPETLPVAPVAEGKKERRKSVYYKPAPVDALPPVTPVGTDNPADKPMQYKQGGIAVQGVEIEDGYGSLVVKVRAKGLYWKDVTLRQLLAILDQQYTEQPQE